MPRGHLSERQTSAAYPMDTPECNLSHSSSAGSMQATLAAGSAAGLAVFPAYFRTSATGTTVTGPNPAARIPASILARSPTTTTAMRSSSK